MYHRYRARLYGLLPIPRSACILSNPQECAVGTHGILAILTISSSTSSSDRPGESSTRLYTNHPSRSPSTFTRSPDAFLPRDLSLRCTSIPLLVHACRFIRRFVETCKRSRDEPEKGSRPLPEHVRILRSIAAILYHL